MSLNVKKKYIKKISYLTICAKKIIIRMKMKKKITLFIGTWYIILYRLVQTYSSRSTTRTTTLTVPFSCKIYLLGNGIFFLPQSSLIVDSDRGGRDRDSGYSN